MRFLRTLRPSAADLRLTARSSSSGSAPRSVIGVDVSGSWKDKAEALSSPVWLQESAPLDRSRASCLLCGARPAHFLAVVHSEPGDQFALPAAMVMCRQCLELQIDHSDVQLAARLLPEFDAWGRGEVVTFLHRRFSEVLEVPPPGTEFLVLRGNGFDPFEEHSADLDAVAVWPRHHRVQMPDPRFDSPSSRVVWLVRSPWPTIALVEVFTLLWDCVKDLPNEIDTSERPERLAEALRWDEQRARRRVDLIRAGA